MSRRQQDRDLLGRAALQAAAAAALGYAIYVAIAVRDSILNLHQNGKPSRRWGSSWWGSWKICAIPGSSPCCSWGILLVVALYFAAKGRLYKLNLMEMLSQER